MNLSPRPCVPLLFDNEIGDKRAVILFCKDNGSFALAVSIVKEQALPNISGAGPATQVDGGCLDFYQKSFSNISSVFLRISMDVS